MEELQALVTMLNALPALALWVLIGFWVYKVAIIGSIYGVIRFCVTKFVEWRTTPQHTLQVVDVEAKIRSTTVSECHEDLIAQIERLRNIDSLVTIGSNYAQTGRAYMSTYIHPKDVAHLRRAIDMLFVEAQQKQKEMDARCAVKHVTAI